MRLSNFRLSMVLLAGIVSCWPGAAQQLISAKSGLIHYTEGDVKIGDQLAGPNNAVFQSLANGKELTTSEGRAEMLLGPGQFVRLNENSAVLMVSNKLGATRLDVLKGSVLVEIVDLEKGSPVTIGFGTATIELRKAGLYRVDVSENRLRVFDGEAVVRASGQSLTAKKAKEVMLGAVLAENGFDVSAGDEFTRWASRRAGYVATANISGARDLYANGTNWASNNWAYNPWYGMYTFIPGRRMFASPFGFNYFTPDMAFNGMFWNYLGGGYGFYGLGYGYGNPYYYGNGYNNVGNYGGGGGGGKVTVPNRPGTPVNNRGDAFGPRGTSIPNYGNNNGGYASGPAMVRGGGGQQPTRSNGDFGGSVRGGGGYNTVSGGGHAGGGGGYSGGGGRSTGPVSGGGGGGSIGATAPTAPAGGGAMGGGASAGGRAK